MNDTYIQQTLDGADESYILILGPVIPESVNGCVLALFLNIPFDLYLAFRITTLIERLEINQSN